MGVRVIIDYEVKGTGEHPSVARRCLFNRYYSPYNPYRLAEDLWILGSKVGGLGSLFTKKAHVLFGDIEETVEGKRYETRISALLASDSPMWIWEDIGETNNLYRTPDGDYFLYRVRAKQVKPLTLTEAVESYKRIRNKWMPFNEAFPWVKAEEV